MTEVAEAAGCSTTTVSHVLNGTRTVAAETRRRVERAMAQLGYRRRVTRPGRAPKNLSAVGLTLPGVSNPYFSELVQGVERELARAGRVLVQAETHDDPETERRAVASLLTHRVDALIMAPSIGWAERTWPLLVDRRVSFVLVDRLVQGEVDQIAVENEPGSKVLVEHLLALGHRRVAMITGLPGLSTTLERELGYRRAHARRGVRVDPALMECGESGVDGGRRAMLRLLDRTEPPTAVFTSNNAMTVGAMTALAERRVQVPQDVALVGFDDFEWSGLLQPALTTAAQPCHAIGARAVQLLLSRLANPNQPARTLRVPASIEHRDSCGCERATSQDASVPGTASAAASAAAKVVRPRPSAAVRVAGPIAIASVG
jgi:LacI family transcriptional regulator